MYTAVYTTLPLINYVPIRKMAVFYLFIVFKCHGCSMVKNKDSVDQNIIKLFFTY